MEYRLHHRLSKFDWSVFLNLKPISYFLSFIWLGFLSRIYSGHALGFWICGCSLFYKRELCASKSAGAHSTKSFKICGCKRWCPKNLRVRAPAAPVLTHSLNIAPLLRKKSSSTFCRLSKADENYRIRKSNIGNQTFLTLHLCIDIWQTDHKRWYLHPLPRGTSVQVYHER